MRVAVVLGLAQAAWCVAATVAAPQRLLGLGLGLLIVRVAAARSRPPEGRRQLQVILGAVVVVNLVLAVVGASQGLQPRLLLLATLLGYVAAGVAVAISAWSTVRFAAALPITIASVAPLFALELILAGTSHANEFNPASVVEEDFAIPPPPTGDGRYPADFTWLTRYPDNPRGYFEIPPDTSPRWFLQAHAPAAAATLEEDTGTARVILDSLPGSLLWHVQLRHRPIPLQAGRLYTIQVRLRAESRRPVVVVMTQTSSDAMDVGFPSQRLSIDTAWQTVRQTFRATASGDASFFLELGGHPGWVDVSDVVVVDDEAGVPAGAGGRDASVAFRFNALGCRGSTPVGPRPPDTVRLLALGDAYTLGAGVHEPDTWPARLELVLNAATSDTATRFEVLNCGVNGLGVGDLRAVFDSVVDQYAPQAVIVALNPGDDARRPRDVYPPAAPEDTRLSRLLLTWHWLREWRHARSIPPLDTTLIAAQLAELQAAATTRGARLAVIVFSHRGGPRLTALEELVQTRFARTEVPVFLPYEQLRAFRQPELDVYPRLDPHPNEVAHRIVGTEVERVLRDAGMLVRPEPPPPPPTPRR